jgi:hypothetical protein
MIAEEEAGSDDEAQLAQNDIDIDDDNPVDDDDEEEPYRDPPEGFIRIRPSSFNYIPGTIFIEYPPELGNWSTAPLFMF